MRKKPWDGDGDGDKTLNQIYGARGLLYKEVGPWGLAHPWKLYLVGVNTPYVITWYSPLRLVRAELPLEG